MARTLGFPHDFRPTPWDDLVEECEQRPPAHYLRPILTSVRDSSVRAHLAGALWMNDLAVVAAPVGEPPMDVVVVSATGSLRPPGTRGLVRIEHRTVTGRNDTIERPPEDAAALFWRFVIEKFGVASR
jgi:hypothetical protein